MAYIIFLVRINASKEQFFDGDNYIRGCINSESTRCELCEKEYYLYQSSNMKTSCNLDGARANPALYADRQIYELNNRLFVQNKASIINFIEIFSIQKNAEWQ